MGNEPGSHARTDDFSGNTSDDFVNRDKQRTAQSRSLEKLQMGAPNPLSNGPPADDSLDMFADFDPVDNRGQSDSRIQSRSRAGSEYTANPFAIPVSDMNRERAQPTARERADSNPFAKKSAGDRVAVPKDDDLDWLDDKPSGAAAAPEEPAEVRSRRDSLDDDIERVASEKASSTQLTQRKSMDPAEVIEQAVEGLGGNSLWICISKRGVAFRFTPSFDDKDDDRDGVEFGDVAAVSEVAEDANGVTYVKLALGSGPGALSYWVPTISDGREVMVKVTSEDAVHGENTFIFRVDREGGVRFCSQPIYESQVCDDGFSSRLEDNHLLTSRIVMVGGLGHRFALDPWSNYWVPEMTPRGRVQLYALNLMKENVKEVYTVVAEQGIAFRASPRFHEKLPGDDGVDRGDVLAVHARMKSMTRPHDIWFALVANSVRWLPLTSTDGTDLLKKVDTDRSEYVFQVTDRTAKVFLHPDFNSPANETEFLPPGKIITCCAKVSGPASSETDFYLLTDGKHWVCNEDELGDEQLSRVKMLAYPFLYKCVSETTLEDNRTFVIPSLHGYQGCLEGQRRKNVVFKPGELVAARLRVEDNGILFVLSAKTLTWIPTVDFGEDGEARRCLFEPVSKRSRGTLVHFDIQKLGLKDASTAGYTNPYIQVSLVDNSPERNGTVMEDQETQYAHSVEDRHVLFKHRGSLTQPLELLEDSTIFFEFKHYKKDKHMVSTKCYSSISGEELACHYEDFERQGRVPIPLQLMIYKSEKPTDFAKKWSPSRLSVKELFMHVTISFTKHVKKPSNK